MNNKMDTTLNFAVKKARYIKERLLRMIDALKRFFGNLYKTILLHLSKVKLSLLTTFTPGRLTSVVLNSFSNSVTVAVGVAICIVLYTPFAQTAISNYEGIDNIFIASAGLLGTLLALVPTLAIIPIQRSVEVYGSTITRLYVRDRVTQTIIVAIGAMCILSFLLPISIVSYLAKSLLLPIQILFICISLDLLRLHHRRVTNFLGPRQAILSLMNEVIKHIHSVQKRISRISNVQQKIFSLKGAQDIPNQCDIEKFHYHDMGSYNQWLKKSIDELFEVGSKAIMRRDLTTARLAIVSIKNITLQYIHSRKDNISFYHEANMVFNSDANKVVETIYQRFETMNSLALSNNLEFISLSIFENSADIIKFMIQLSDENSHINLSSTIWLPLGFYKNYLAFSIKSNSDDATLQAIRILTKIIQGSPNDTRYEDLYHTCINMLEQTAISFLQKENGTLVNETVKEMLKIANHTVTTNHFQKDNIISTILKSIESMLPISLLLERRSSHFGIPVITAYDLTNNLSLGYLVELSFAFVKPVNDQRSWMNPYYDVISINKHIYRHFREIADNLQFNDSWFLWHITQTLKHISHVYLSHIQSPVTNNEDHTKELVSQLQWYLSFFWSSFKIQTTISSNRAEHACESLAWIGLASIEIKQFEVTLSCANNISSIIDSCLKLGKSSPRDVATMYMKIWLLYLIAEKHDYQSIAQQLDRYNLTSDRFNDTDWNIFQGQIESDQKEIINYLSNPYEHRHELDELRIILVRLYFKKDNE